MSYYFLMDIALILISTKLFGLITKKIEMPQVVGALLAGLILGPACLNMLHETDFLMQVSEIGVIILMYSAGLETNVSELKKCGKASMMIAILGVIVPLLVGFGIASIFNTGSDALLENIFIGIILTATSVSITVETLKEMGKLSTKSGNAILGAALIDDVLGIIALTIITGVSSGNVNIGLVLIKIVVFFAISCFLGLYLHKLIDLWMGKADKDRRRFSVLAFAFCLIYAFLAEEIFGVADITGAFIAGLIIANTKRSHYVAHRTDSLGYMFFTPVFFASIGLKVVIPEITPMILGFAVLITLGAILSKIIGCGIGAKMSGMNGRSCVRVGVGMISRGEVALIIASKGIALGIMHDLFFAPIIIMVVITTVMTPIFLKVVYSKGNEENEEVVHEEAIYRNKNSIDLDWENWMETNHFKDYTKIK